MLREQELGLLQHRPAFQLRSMYRAYLILALRSCWVAHVAALVEFLLDSLLGVFGVDNRENAYMHKLQ